MLFWVARFVMWVLTHIMYRYKVTGTENIPEQGGFILCSNHMHSLDPAIHAIHIKRRMYFMGKKELFQNWATNIFFRGLGAFPVDRGTADLKSYKTAVNLLKNNQGLLIFIQGTRMKEVDIKDAKGGPALFALKTNIPIIPAGISATYKMFSKVHVCYGKAITLEKYQGQRIKSELIDEITALIMTDVQQLSTPMEV